MPGQPEVVKPDTRPLPRPRTVLEPGRLSSQADNRQDGRREPVSPIRMKARGTTDQGYRFD